jgi:hypothetical protein
MILLYADDPGGANFLSPIADALSAGNLPNRFLISPELLGFAADRGMNCLVRTNTITAEDMLKDVKFLVVGTSEDRDCFAHQLVEAARLSKINSLGVVDMAVNAAHRFSGRSKVALKYAPDWLAVTDNSSAHAFIELGYSANHVLICGNPHFDEVRYKRRSFMSQDLKKLRQTLYHQAPPGRPIWLFLAEGVDQLNPVVSFRSSDYTLHGRGAQDFRCVVVLEEVLDAAAELHPRPWVVLRLHPKNQIEEFKTLAPEIGMVSQIGDPLPLVWSADLVLGMTTMLLLETYLLGRPHLAILPRAIERTWLYTTNEGLTKSVFTRSSLRALLSTPYENLTPSLDDLPKDAIKMLVSHIREKSQID